MGFLKLCRAPSTSSPLSIFPILPQSFQPPKHFRLKPTTLPLLPPSPSFSSFLFLLHLAIPPLANILDFNRIFDFRFSELSTSGFRLLRHIGTLRKRERHNEVALCCAGEGTRAGKQHIGLIWILFAGLKSVSRPSSADKSEPKSQLRRPILHFSTNTTTDYRLDSARLDSHITLSRTA
ncbi:uncharacterized protein F4817DRAFT_134619 [Daldinia loculata]|uniref:uncharacterized protein n=1 Tax=Daldinia loculata TaxID=103429 RepID=UPI0020C53EFA|nr:uncharacterized protein F4817DRAFT_134619 [Daldinia loculata]KAI1651543.1 hypothetical protein F4817DRAFT_134619 [Daldinia loculata]